MWGCTCDLVVCATMPYYFHKTIFLLHECRHGETPFGTRIRIIVCACVTRCSQTKSRQVDKIKEKQSNDLNMKERHETKWETSTVYTLPSTFDQVKQGFFMLCIINEQHCSIMQSVFSTRASWVYSTASKILHVICYFINWRIREITKYISNTHLVSIICGLMNQPFCNFLLEWIVSTAAPNYLSKESETSRNDLIHPQYVVVSIVLLYPRDNTFIIYYNIVRDCFHC